ncbi:uncharacterized protein LOC110766878 [Prunus avium]|uniref:Uncharacterized protein LOC110766878 n=1 Tax=Prunus avium TaxID=42229 RepID=A0A6P5TG15_PRUAV|nr:uncharacterized protein LOC110766878 [Prunus avium]
MASNPINIARDWHAANRSIPTKPPREDVMVAWKYPLEIWIKLLVVVVTLLLLTFALERNAVGNLGLLPEQKFTAVIRMLVYGSSADQVDEIARMGKSTALETLVRFCDAVETLYTRDYLRRPTPRDLQRLLQKDEEIGFPGMIGSIDCMHWQWKNCPTALQGDYGNRKGQKSIILEAVAGFDTWVWHAFFGVAGSQNDLNVLG